MLPAVLLILQTVSLTGEVREAGRLEPIRFATVRVLEAPERVVRTDRDGYFSLELGAGRWTLEVAAPGYRDLERVVQLTGEADVHLRLELEPAPLAVEGVSAVADARRGAPGFDALVVDSALVALSPTPIERDVLRAVQSLPAVTPASDFSGALYVRGGTPDQTRLFLDGAPVFNPYHLGGFVSAFDPSSVASAVLIPGGAAAGEPSSLSGNLRIATRDGGRDSTRVRGGVGLLSSRFAVDGPVSHGRGGYLLSLRRTYLDLATDLAKALDFIDYTVPYDFTDAHAKLTHDLGYGGKLNVSGYVNSEGLQDIGDQAVGEEFLWRWGTQMLSVRARGMLRGVGRAEVGAAVSRFAGRFRQGGQEGLDLDAAFRYETLDARVDHPVGRHVLSAGGRVERTPYRYDLEPGSDFADRLVGLDVEGVATSSALFLEDRWRPVPAVEARLGVRAEKHGAFAWRWLPRAGLAVEPSDRLRLSLAGGRYAQGFTSLRNEEAGLASIVAYDLLVPPTSVLPGGWDVTAGAQWRGDAWSVRADAYWKRLEDIPLAPRESDPATAPIYLGPEAFEVGDGRVRGLELGVRGRVGGWDAAAAYRLQKEERRAGDVTWTPRSDRTHRLTLAGRRPWGEGSVNVALSWISGQPFTPVSALVPGVAGYDAAGRPLSEDFDLPLLGPHNSARLPGYLRLDVGLRGRWRWSVAGRDIEVEPYLSVMNVLNRKNVLWGEYAGGRTVKLEYGPQLPVLPSFGLRFRF